MILTTLEEATLRDLVKDGGSAIMTRRGTRADWLTTGTRATLLDARTLRGLERKGKVQIAGARCSVISEFQGVVKAKVVADELGWIG